MLIDWCHRLAEDRRFQGAILLVILANAVLVGLETSAGLAATYGPLLASLNRAILLVFVLEMAIRLVASGPQFGRFFRDSWNVFDLAVVALSLLPAVGTFATVARLARVFRVLRMISVLPELRLIVSTLLRSLPSVGNVAALLMLLLYVYGVVGCHLLGRTDPAHWGSLGKALLTLFAVLTLEGWVEVQNASLSEHPWIWLFFGSFIVTAVFVVFNLFIAVVLNSMESVKAEHQAEEDARNPGLSLLRRVDELRDGLDQFERALRHEPLKAPPVHPPPNGAGRERPL